MGIYIVISYRRTNLQIFNYEVFLTFCLHDTLLVSRSVRYHTYKGCILTLKDPKFHMLICSSTQEQCQTAEFRGNVAEEEVMS